jgi:hypothetical protein
MLEFGLTGFAGAGVAESRPEGTGGRGLLLCSLSGILS